MSVPGDRRKGAGDSGRAAAGHYRSGSKTPSDRGDDGKTLAPYYEMLREKREVLPDLYSLAPDPTVDYYYDVLGGDVNCANLLPNEIDQIAGKDVSGVGVAFISFDPRREWPAEKKEAGHWSS